MSDKHFDSLEQRTLFSTFSTSVQPVAPVNPGVSDSAVNSVHLLSVEGTAWDDNILVRDEWTGDVVAYVNGWEVGRMPRWFCTAVSVHGRAGNDGITNLADVPATWLYGDDGDDTLSGTPAVGEQFFGGAGRDAVTYADRWAGLNLSLDNTANDGQLGENDNIRWDVEVVYGGQGNDTISGGPYADALYGNGGNDVLHGNGGNDQLDGGWGNDFLYGDDDNDWLDGGYGADAIYGGAGWDDVDYRSRWGNVTVTLDWAADDGEAGEFDRVWTDVEAAWGGFGNDRLVGSAGDNCLFGMQGDDVLVGGDGNDTLYGYYGNDILIGGQGVDTLRGEQDNDTLVAVGGTASDVLEGGAGVDNFWCDGEWTETIDADSTEWNGAHVNRVWGFMDYHFGFGPAVPVGREPLGESLADPKATGYSDFAGFKNFSGNPLFQNTTPFADDIRQTKLGDCYFLAALGSMARTNPDFIRRSVVDLGDGSYAVRFFRNNAPVYVRVDGDLPVNGSGMPFLARPGLGGALWGPIMEKAYAFFRQGDGNYQSIDGGFPDEVFTAMGVNYSFHGTNIFGNWEGGSGSLLSYVMNEVWSGKAVTLCTRGGSLPKLVDSHCYTVDGIVWDAGQWKVRVRNPWGVDGPTVEGADDGYLTLTADELAANCDRVYSGFVA